MSFYNSITIYASDTDGLGTETPTLDAIKSHMTSYSGVDETFEVIQFHARVGVEVETTDYLGNFSLTANKMRYEFDPIPIKIQHDSTIQSIEDKFQLDWIEKKYKWILLGETDGGATEAWTKEHEVQPQAIITATTTPKCIAVNLESYSIAYNNQQADSEITMKFKARKTGEL